jgi:hypothetical protein
MLDGLALLVTHHSGEERARVRSISVRFQRFTESCDLLRIVFFRESALCFLVRSISFSSVSSVRAVLKLWPYDGRLTLFIGNQQS